MGFAQMREHRQQIANTVKPGTPFRAAILMSREIAFIQTTCKGDFAKERAMLAELGPLRSRGHGGRHPHHASARYVSMDKRAATKARNRRRNK